MDALAANNSMNVVAVKTDKIGRMLLGESKHVRTPNFNVIHQDDLSRLFALYDESFFGGGLLEMVAQKSTSTLSFRLSSVMTRAGGKTIRLRTRQLASEHNTRYEIAISSRLLFWSFGKIDRSITVCGLACANRLQALQRIMEHEIVHLIELLTWDRSSCSAGRFKLLAKNIFGHGGTTHDLVTPIEHAALEHDIRLGQSVEFRFKGVRHVGTVSGIRHRATVLVESSDGVKYSDGKKYLKFYIPVSTLTQMTR